MRHERDATIPIQAMAASILVPDGEGGHAYPEVQ